MSAQETIRLKNGAEEFEPAVVAVLTALDRIINADPVAFY